MLSEPKITYLDAPVHLTSESLTVLRLVVSTMEQCVTHVDSNPSSESGIQAFMIIISNGIELYFTYNS